MAFAIHERELRARLEVRPKPYYIRVADGVHLGYRKGKAVSRWVIRTARGAGYRTRTVEGVEPDDRLDADGVHVLSFQQMMERVMSEMKSEIACSFCGKDRHEVAKLVAGPGVFICNECVALCQLYIENPAEDQKLLLEDGKPVLENGKPVFVPLSEDELRMRDELLASDP